MHKYEQSNKLIVSNYNCRLSTVPLAVLSASEVVRHKLVSIPTLINGLTSVRMIEHVTKCVSLFDRRHDRLCDTQCDIKWCGWRQNKRSARSKCKQDLMY